MCTSDKSHKTGHSQQVNIIPFRSSCGLKASFHFKDYIMFAPYSNTTQLVISPLSQKLSFLPAASRILKEQNKRPVLLRTSPDLIADAANASSPRAKQWRPKLSSTRQPSHLPRPRKAVADSRSSAPKATLPDIQYPVRGITSPSSRINSSVNQELVHTSLFTSSLSPSIVPQLQLLTCLAHAPQH